MSVLRMRLGECFRLERLYGIYMRKGWPAGKLHADYGASSPHATSPHGEFYTFPDNRMSAGFVTGSWNLNDTGSDVGGFCVVTGQPQGELPHSQAHPRSAPGFALGQGRRGPGRQPHPVHRSLDPRHGALGRRPRTSHLALQVLRLEHELGRDPGHATRGSRTHAAATAIAGRAGRTVDALSVAVLGRTGGGLVAPRGQPHKMAIVVRGRAGKPHRARTRRRSPQRIAR